MPRLDWKAIAFVAACGASLPPIISAQGAEESPAGPWQTTNNCFLSAFLLSEDGGAQTRYLSGERDEDAVWTWDGETLSITSPEFPLDSFAGRLTEGRIEADYVWHDLDTDAYNPQQCVFERFAPAEA